MRARQSGSRRPALATQQGARLTVLGDPAPSPHISAALGGLWNPYGQVVTADNARVVAAFRAMQAIVATGHNYMLPEAMSRAINKCLKWLNACLESAKAVGSEGLESATAIAANSSCSPLCKWEWTRGPASC